MKQILLLILALPPLFSGRMPAGEPLIESFENTTDGATAESTGWVSLGGQGELADLKITSPTSPDNSSALCLTGAPNGPDILIGKPFETPFDYTDSQHLIEYSVKVVPQASGGTIHRVIFGVQDGSGKVLGLFGIPENNGSTKEFQFNVADSCSSGFYPAAHLYEVRLRIDTSKGLARAAGTLQFRDLTDANKEWRTAEGLEAVPLYLEGRWDPSQWKGWYIRSAFRREFDDLSLSAL